MCSVSVTRSSRSTLSLWSWWLLWWLGRVSVISWWSWDSFSNISDIPYNTEFNNSIILLQVPPGGFQQRSWGTRRNRKRILMFWLYFISQTIQHFQTFLRSICQPSLSSARFVLNFLQIWKTRKANMTACTSRCSIWKKIKSWPATRKYGRHFFNIDISLSTSSQLQW